MCNLRHGMFGTPTYTAWASMLRRCQCKHLWNYSNYGGRGIKVCKRWLQFKNFLKDMGVKPSVQYSLDRTDNNKGYGPKNCRWATLEEQSGNRRNVIKIEGKCLKAICREKGLKYPRTYYRFKKGWPLEKVFQA